MPNNRTEYVVGFLVDDNRVVLIEKQRPLWQKGMLNGVGGHIESGESPSAAMRREFREEAGMDILQKGWTRCVVMTGQSWRVHFFIGRGAVRAARTQTDEVIRVEKINELPRNVIPNLRWLIPLCLDIDIAKPVKVFDSTENSDAE